MKQSFQIWIGEEMPKRYADMVARVERMFHGKHFLYNSFDLPKEIQEKVDSLPKIFQKVDILRLFILSRFPDSVYLDCDAEFVKDWEPPENTLPYLPIMDAEMCVITAMRNGRPSYDNLPNGCFYDNFIIWGNGNREFFEWWLKELLSADSARISANVDIISETKIKAGIIPRGVYNHVGHAVKPGTISTVFEPILRVA